MPPTVPGPGVNRLLAGLPRKDRLHALAGCENVELSLAQAICDPGERMRYVYFPTDSFISLVVPIKGIASLEVGMVGNEGVVGASLMLDVNESTLHGIVQGAGAALRMNAALFRREVELSPALRQKLNRYLYVQIGQLAQTAACTRFHLVEARLARWLLMTRDRARSDKFRVTQAFLAYMLGVRRVGVTKAAGALQDRKLICYNRGNIAILNGRRLEAAACECYAAGKALYENVLG